ncbi:MAG: ROK family protein [Anaerolineae bacterium]|nr:ROK family protein [Anaerolineae bacterium]
MTQYLLAVDLGGTKIAAALVSTDGAILARNQEPTCQTGPQDGMEQIARLLRGLIADSGLATNQILGVGIGIPAVLERDTDFVIWGPNLTGWRNVAVKPELEQRINLPVYIEYDGHTAVLGEWWQGAARGYGSVAEVIIGTGIGGGLILDGRLVRGMNRLAGAAGWFALTTNAAPGDDRGHAIGHWESLAAGPGIAHRAQMKLAQYPDSRLTQLTDALTAKDVFDADALGDPLAVQIIDETADLIGLGIANIVSVVNPEIVILGGGIGAQRGERLLPRISAVARRWAQPISAESVAIKPSSLGADGGLLGAAYAVLNRLSEDRKERAT